MKRTPSWIGAATLSLLSAVCVVACAGAAPDAGNAHTAAAAPADPKPAPKPADAADYSSPAGFTRAAVALVRAEQPNVGWASPMPLKLTNQNGIQVNLERIWQHCQVEPGTCAEELDHLAREVLKVSTRPNPMQASPERIFAVVRPASYFDSMPAEARDAALREPLTADLMVLYVVDEGGAVRGATAADLTDVGLGRGELPAAARGNLLKVLSAPPGQGDCRPHAVSVWSSGNYYESSRLLLSDFWQQLAERTHRTIVAAAPSADALVVVCDPTAAELRQLNGKLDHMARMAARPLSTTLLKWTPGGWQELEQ